MTRIDLLFKDYTENGAGYPLTVNVYNNMIDDSYTVSLTHIRPYKNSQVVNIELENISYDTLEEFSHITELNEDETSKTVTLNGIDWTYCHSEEFDEWISISVVHEEEENMLHKKDYDAILNDIDTKYIVDCVTLACNHIKRVKSL